MSWDETHSAVSVRPRAGEQSVDSVIEGWARLFAYLVVVIVIGFTLVMPFPGLLLALTGASYLRAGDIHARRHPGGLLRQVVGPLTAPFHLIRGLIGTLVSLPYAAVFAVIIPPAIVVVAAVDIEIDPLVAASWGVGAATYVLLAAPGVRAPRRQLTRMFVTVAHEPRRIAALGAVLCAATVAAMAGAVALEPSFAPMYELKNVIAQQLSRFQDVIQQRVS